MGLPPPHNSNLVGSIYHAYEQGNEACIFHSCGVIVLAKVQISEYRLELGASLNRKLYSLVSGMSKLCLNQSISVIVSLSRDTVESILFARHSLPRTSFNEDIRIFRHALSVDERRVFYAPSLFGPPQSGAEQDVQELWFVGSHSGWCHVQEHRILPLLTLSLDVGGRWGKDTPLDSNPSARPNLSNISLLWMVLECKSKCNDIKFREDLQINLDAFHGCHLRDEIHDTLRSLKGCWWWILEVFSCVVIVYTCHLYL